MISNKRKYTGGQRTGKSAVYNSDEHIKKKSLLNI